MLSLSLLALVLGIALLVQVSTLKNVLVSIPGFEEQGSALFSVIVEPRQSSTGTWYFVSAKIRGRVEPQHILVDVQNNQYSNTIDLFDDGEHFDGIESDGTYGGYFDSSGKPIGEYNVSFNEKQLTSFLVYQPRCEPLIGKSLEENINFVLIPSGYENYDEFKTDANALLTGRNSLLSVEPFISQKQKFSFSLVNASQNIECKEQCFGEGSTILCCDNSMVIDEASQCHYDQIIVLHDSETLCGSTSSYAKVCAKNELSKLILMHEVGHSFADLADEYTYSSNAPEEQEKANCAQAECKKWDNITDGCYQGCSSSSLYRSVEENSIMYTYKPIFNEVSKRQIENIISRYKIRESAGEKETFSSSFVVPLSYEQGAVNFGAVYKKPLAPPKEVKDSPYQAVITNAKGNVLFQTPVILPIELLPLPNTADIPKTLESFNHSILLPYYVSAAKLTLFRNNREIATTSLAVLSELCGNQLCDSGENHLTCAVDCSLEKDNLCESSTCDPDCPSQKNCVRKRAWLKGSAVLLMAGALITIIFIIIRMKHNR